MSVDQRTQTRWAAGQQRPRLRCIQRPIGAQKRANIMPACIHGPGVRLCLWHALAPRLLQVRVVGALRLPSGDVNLVATQLALDRDHANLITFQPEEQTGLDPLVDLVMNGGDLRVAIKVGAAVRLSACQLVLLGRFAGSAAWRWHLR